MNNSKLAWYQLSRDEIPDTVLGTASLTSREQQISPAPSIGTDSVGSAGFAWEGASPLEHHAPTAFVLDERTIAETLSWLRVYAGDTFPLSQFARVLSSDDWEMLSGNEGTSRSFRDDRWSSVVLGELLAQSEQDVTLDSLSLSRVQACFSIAVARAHKFYDSYKVTRACTERLRAIEADPRFLRRSVNIDSLVPVWSLASAEFGHISDLRELSDFILTAAFSYDDPKQQRLIKPTSYLPDALYSDSIEERVIAFQKVSMEATERFISMPNSYFRSAATVAVAAFLVGKGTSHAFLIKRQGRLAPMAHVWFGLIAGLAGPAFWDPLWAKALKGVEKHVRVSFSWADPPLSDISWAEHKWVSGAIRGAQALQGIPRQVQTSLSIEILPGVSCQMRLHTDDSRNQVKSSVSQTVAPPLQERASLPPELIAAIEDLYRFSEKARNIVRKNTKSTDDLFKPSESSKAKKTSRKPKT